MSKEGWICPRCGKALAPWMSECSCYLNRETIISNNTLNLDQELKHIEDINDHRSDLIT